MSLGFLYGLGVGALLGLTGAGGGILAIPALVLGMGYDPRAAAPVALLAVGVSAALAAIDGLRLQLVRWRAGLLMATTGLACTPLGVKLARELPASVLLTLFACLMLYVAGRMLLQRRRPSSAKAQEEAPANASASGCTLDPSNGRFRWTARCAATLAGIGSACGLMTGMLGVGGGFVIVPAFKQWTNVQPHGTVATSLFVIALVTMGAAATSLAAGARLDQSGVLFVLAAVGGMVIGRKVSPRLSASTVQTSFSLLAIAVAMTLLHRAWAS